LNTSVIKQVGCIKFRVVALYKRRVGIVGARPKEMEAVVDDLLDVLVGSVAQIAIIIM